MEVQYKCVIIEGFGSIVAPTKFDLSPKGLNIISGKNGVGKTTVFESLIWAEYGEAYKDNPATWERHRGDNWKGTRVVLVRYIGGTKYMVVRHLDYTGETLGYKRKNTLMLFQKPVDAGKFTSEDLVDALHKSDVQELIHQQLGLSYNAFKRTVVMPQRKESLISSSAKTKREFFTEIFNVDLEEVEQRVKEKYNELSNSCIIQQNKLNATEKALKDVKSFKEEAEEELRNFEVKQAAAIAAAEKEAEEAKKAINQIKEKLNNLTSPKESIAEKTQLKEQRSKAINQIKEWEQWVITYNKNVDKWASQLEHQRTEYKKIKEAISSYSGECKSCGRKLAKTKREAYLKTLKKDLDTSSKLIEDFQKRLEQDEEQLVINKAKFSEWEQRVNNIDSQLLELANKIADYENKATSFKTNIKLLNKDIKQASEKIAVQKSLTPPNVGKYVKRMETLERDINALESKLDSLEVELGHIGFWKKSLGAKGIRSFILNASLATLNKTVQNYAKELGLLVHISLDLSKKSTPFVTDVYKDGNVTSYNDLSGGEKQRVDLCLSFGLHEMITRKHKFNLVVFDEAFEGLDSYGIAAAFSLLRKVAQKRTVFVITHQIPDVQEAKVIQVINENGKTKFV